MRSTIRTQLYGLTATGLVFLAAVGATGYWGITTVEMTTAEVAATGEAIRTHVQAPAFVDMTREDFSSAVHKTGQDRQDSLDNLGVHSQVLTQRISAARDSRCGDGSCSEGRPERRGQFGGKISERNRCVLTVGRE